MRSLGVVLILAAIAAFAASQLVDNPTLDVVLVAAGVLLLLAGVGLVLFGGRRRPEQGMVFDRGDRALPPVASPPPGEGPADTGGRSLSSPVPMGAASEPPATSGTGTAAPAPVVRSADDELPAASTASATDESTLRGAPALDDGSAGRVERRLDERREAPGPHHPALEDSDGEPR